MSWFPSREGIFVSLIGVSAARLVWIRHKFDDHRFLRFVGWPRPFDRTGRKEYFWTSGTSRASRAEVERALSPQQVA